VLGKRDRGVAQGSMDTLDAAFIRLKKAWAYGEDAGEAVCNR
jgi:hypothetical protein